MGWPTTVLVTVAVSEPICICSGNVPVSESRLSTLLRLSEKTMFERQVKSLDSMLTVFTVTSKPVLRSEPMLPQGFEAVP